MNARIAASRTAMVFWMAFSFVLLIVLVGKIDYQIALEQENERLKARLAPKPDARQAYQALLCPSGNSIAQRIDKRRWDGVIYKSRWQRTCT